MTRFLLSSILAGAVLAACSDDAPPEAETADTEPAPAAEPSATIGGDGSDLVLTGLEESDVDGRLQGELNCAFTGENGDTLLIASANVGGDEPIFALVKVGDTIEVMAGRAGGGYDRMVNGTGYGGRGLTVEIARLSSQSLNAGREGLAYDATLRADRADGARRTWDGVWSCGP